jgi:hypothetical protein
VTRAKISQYSATANDNTDVNGVNIAEGCPPSSMNNMGREIMAALKRFQVGSDGDGVTVGGALVVSGATTANTLSATAVNATGTVTFSGSVILSGTTTANTFSTDLITEKTSAAGVTIDGVLLKDNGVVTGAGTVSAPVYSTTGDLNTGIFFPAADTIAFAEGGAEAMRINSSGNVLIGATATVGGSKFLVAGASSSAPAVIQGASSQGSYLDFYNNGATSTSTRFRIGQGFASASDEIALLYNTANAAMVFGTNNTERARITSSGVLLIGTSLALGGSKLCVSESTNASETVYFDNTNASFTQRVISINASRNTTNGTYTFISCSISNVAEKFRVLDSGNVQNSNNSYGSLSDVKLKQDIVDASSQWDDIKGLRVRKYRLKSDPDGFMQLGLVAQEAELVSPGLVEEHPDYEEVEVTDEEGNVTTERQATGTTTKAVKYSVLYMKAVKALQEAMERIETLEAKNDALEARIAALEAVPGNE